MKDMRPGARVARGATYVFAQGFASTVIGIVYIVILARLLSLEEMGVFAILTFIITLAQVFGTFALPSASTKYIAQYLAEGDPTKARSVVARVLQISLLASTTLSIMLFVFAEWLSTTLLGTPVWTQLFCIIAPVSFLQIIYTQSLSFLRGLQRMREMAAVALTYSVVQKSLVIYLLLYTGWGLYSVAYGWLTGLVVSSLMSLILTTRFLGILGKPHPARTLVNFSYPLYISGILAFAASWVDRLFVLPYLGAAYLGMYHIAIRAAAVPSLISTSIVAALFPKLSELYTQAGAESLRGAFHVSTRYAALVGFPTILGLAALAKPVLLIAGVKYAEAALPLTILCLAALPGALGVAIGLTLMTLERTKIASIVTATSVLFNIVVCYMALAYFNLGMLGVAWARVFASLIGFGLGVYALKIILNVSFDKEALWKTSAASIIMATAIMSFRWTLEGIGFHLYLLLPLCAIVGSAVYFFSLVALRAIKKRDVELIHEYLPRGLKPLAVWLGRLAFAE